MTRFCLLTFLISFLIANVANAQTTNDYRSKASGDWTSTGGSGIWERYNGSNWVPASEYPGETAGNAETVTILNTHTVIIDTDAAAATNVVVENGAILEYEDRWNGELTISNDLTINAGGIFRVTQSASSDRSQDLIVSGDIIVDGTFNGFHINGVNEARMYIFLHGASNNSLSGSGTFEIWDMEVDKGGSVANVFEILMPFTIVDAGSDNGRSLYINSGTLKISAATTLKTSYNGTTITEQNGCLWLNNAGIDFGWANTSGNATFNGDFKMDGGAFSCPAYLTIEGSSSGDNYFKNATVTIGSRFDLEQDLLIENSTVTVGENFYVDGNGADEYGNLTINNSTLTTTGNFESTDPSSTIHINSISDINVGNELTADGEIKMEGGTLDVNGRFRIEGSASENNSFIGTAITTGGDCDFEQDVVLTNCTVNTSANFYVDANDWDDFGDIVIDNCIITTAGEFEANDGATVDIKNNTQITTNQQFEIRGQITMDGGSLDIGQHFFIDGFNDKQNTLTNVTVDVGTYCDIEQKLDLVNCTFTTGGYFIADKDAWNDYCDLTLDNTDLTIGEYFDATDGAIVTINNNSNIDVTQQFEIGGQIVMNGGTLDVGSNFFIDGFNDKQNYITDATVTVGSYCDFEQRLQITNSSLTVASYLLVDANNWNEYGELTIDNSNLTIGEYVDITNYGLLQLNSGSLTAGDGNDYTRIRQGAELKITGGTYTQYGQLYTDNNWTFPIFTMTGGELIVDPQHTTNLANDQEIVWFQDQSVVNFTGGKLIIPDPHADKDGVYRDAVDIRGTAGSKNFIGSTIQFGDGSSSSSGDETFPGYSIYIGGTVPLGNIILNNPSGSNRQFINRDNTDIYCNNLTITTANDEFQTTGRILDIKADFVNNGTLNASSNGSQVLFTGSAAQTYSGTGTSIGCIPTLTFNNTSATGVTLEAPIGGTQVNITDGMVYTTGSGMLTVCGTDVNNLVGYSSTQYVAGVLRRALPNNATADNYDFPVGTASDYRLAEMLGISTSGSGSGFITVQFKDEAVGASATGGNSINNSPFNALEVHWIFDHDLSSVDLYDVNSVRFTYPVPAPPPVYALAQSNTGLNGAFNSIGRNVVGNTIQSDSYDLTGITPTGPAYITLAEIEPLRGTYYVGNYDASIHVDPYRFFLNLTEVAQILREKFVDDNVVFEMLDTYDDDTETIPVVFDELRTTFDTYDVTIYPRAGVTGTVTERDAAADGEAIIYIDGVSDLIFDGRPGGSGTSDWTFSNTRSSNPGAVFEFRNGAAESKLSYLTIQSDNQIETTGVIKFGASTETFGNHDISVTYCNITGYSTTPKNGIYSEGSAGKNNSDNIITHNNIYDFFMDDFISHGIHIRDNSTGWTIADNRFYQTAPRTFNTTDDKYNCAIRVRDGENYLIENNIIGYADEAETGYTELNNAANSVGRFVGILFEETTATATSQISNNRISNIKLSTYSTNTDNGFFNAISVRAGNANITGNTIGTTGNFTDYPIQIENLTDNGQVICIFTNTNHDIEVSNNQIGGIQTTGDNRIYFMGVQTNNTGADYLVDNNTIGSSTKANSIAIGEAGYSDDAYVYGIWNFRAEDIVISNNTIANITSFSDLSGNNLGIRGIYSGTNHNDDLTITGNKIFMLTGYSDRNYNSGIGASVIGIIDYNWDTDPTIISQNEIHSLRNLNATGNPYIDVVGIVSAGTGENMIDGNFIHNFNTASVYGRQEGIYVVYSDVTIQNNMIQLGFDENGNPQTGAHRIYGIYNVTSDENHEYYHNSVFIGGSGVTGQNDRNTVALYYTGNTAYKIKNNILVNARSNASGELSKHYAIHLPFDITAELDYNIYYAPATGNGGYLANFDGIDYDKLQGIQWYTNYKDMHSGQGDPKFVNPTGDAATASLKLQAINPAESTGIEITTVTEDFEGDVRASNTPVDIGADAGNFTFNADVDIFAPTFDYTGIDPQNCGVTTATLDVSVTDFNTGVDNSNKPRVWYRDKTTPAAWTSVEGTLQSGDVTEGVWRFQLTGLSDNIFYEYYITAQDAATTSNIGYSKFDANTPVHSTVTLQTTSPSASVDVDVFTVCVFPKATYTVGNFTDCPTCDFETLTDYGDFFFNMNSMLIDKDVTCQIMANTNEPATYSAEQTLETGLGNWTITVTSGTAASKTLFTDAIVNKSQIRLKGADGYVFDGQFEGDGNRWLNFIHQKDDQPVFYLNNDAQNNTLQYLNIKGIPQLSTLGTVFIEDGASSGNDNNIIQNNHITNSISGTMAANAIYSGSTLTDPALANSNMQIKNNLISEFSGCGIWAITDGNDGAWTIEANTMFNSIVSDRDQMGIKIEAGAAHSITYNQIGGSAADGSGTWENSGNVEVNAIELNVDDTEKTIVTNNTIQNMYSSHNDWSYQLRGIRVENGWADITDNTIQNLEKDGLRDMYGISYSGNEPANISDNAIKKLTLNRDHDMYGIYMNTGSSAINTVSNNTFTGISLTDNNTDSNFYGIYLENGTPANVNNNILGGTNTDDHISVAGGDFIGIRISYDNTSDLLTVNNNSFAGLSVTRDSNNSEFRGIDINDGNYAINNNTFGGANTGDKIYVEAGDFTAIEITGDDGAQSISDNSITNVVMNGNSIFRGIDINNIEDNVQIEVANNTVDNIKLNNTGTGTEFYAFNLHDGDLDFNNNTVGTAAKGIENKGSGVTYGIYFDQDWLDDISVHHNYIENISGNGDVTAIFADRDITYDIYSNSVSNISIANNITFNAIHINRGTASVNDNQIIDIELTNTGADSKFRGIWVSGGSASVGTATANIIGTVANPITNNGTGGTNGIAISGGNNTIQNNLISALSGKGGTYGIVSWGGSSDIIDNEIFDFTIANDITFAGIKQSTGSGTNTMERNSIKNIELTNNGANTILKGIWAHDGEYTISSNTLFNLKTAGAGCTNIIDITSTQSGTFDVSSNSISAIEATADASLRAINLEVGGLTTVNVDNNTIFDFKNKGTGDNTHLTGVQLYNSGKANITNNQFGNPAVADDFANDGDGHTNGIYMYTGASGGTINSNTLSNFTQSGDDYLIGINVSLAGTGTATQINDNVLQTFKNTSTGSYASMKGIKAGTGSNGKFQITNNVLTDFEHEGNSSLKLFEIETNTAGNEISDNTILNINNNGIKETVIFYINSNGDCTLDNNSMSDINATHWHSHATLSAMEIAGNGNHTVTNNSITELFAKTIKDNISSGEVALQGIYANGDGSYTISNNSISNLTLSQNAANHIAGFTEDAPNVEFTHNFISGLTNTYTSPVSDKTVSGVLLTRLNTGFIANNFISLGNNDNASYRGVWVAADDASASKKVYFNSIYIGGTATDGDSYAFLRSNVDAPLYLRNNIFSNFRTGGSGKHYAVATENTTWNATYAQANGFYSSELSTTGLWGGSDVDYDTWIANTGGDDMELSNNKEPLFADPANNDLHIDPADACAFNSVGEEITGITTDIDGQTRATHPDIGADEFSPTGGNDRDIWRGWEGTAWENDNNWQCELGPLTTSNLVVPNVTNDPIIGIHAECNDLEIKNNGNVSINANSSLLLNGDLTLNGELNVLSTSAGTGSFIEKGTISGTGNATVERYIAPGGWHYFSSAVQNVSNKAFTEDLNCYSYNRNLLYYNEEYTSTDPTDPKDWQNGWVWMAYTPNSSTFDIPKGYAGFTDGSCKSAIEFAGTAAELNTGNKSITVTNTDATEELNGVKRRGWNLIGNPYPSHLDANAFLTANSGTIDGAVYFWDELGKTGWDDDGKDYACWNGAGTVGTGSGSFAPDGYISVGQGFYVHKTTTGSATVNFDNTMRTNNPAHFYKGGSYTERFKIAVINPVEHYNETLIAFNYNATDEYDSFYDALKMQGNDKLALYSLLNDLAYTIQSYKPFEKGSRIVPLGVNSKIAGVHEFSVTSIENLPYNVYLEDRLLNEWTNMRSISTYEFETTEAVAFTDRFFIHFEINTAPTIKTEVADTEVYEDSELIYELGSDIFEDTDRDEQLSITAIRTNGSSLPDWLTFDAENMTFSGTPLNEHVGEYKIMLIATDLAGKSVTQQFSIAVHNTNDAPELKGDLADYSYNENENFEFSIAPNLFYDADADNLIFSLATENSVLPDWLNFDAEELRVWGQAPANKNMQVMLTLTATDNNGAYCNGYFEININNLNDAPYLNQSIANQNANTEIEFSFTLPSDVFKDPDFGDYLTIEVISELPGWLNFSDDDLRLRGTPQYEDIGVYTVNLQATDLAGESANTVFSIVVTDSNLPPYLLKATENQSMVSGGIIILELNELFADDNEGDEISIELKKPDGTALPEWLFFNPNTLQLFGVAPNDFTGTIEIQATATDSKQAECTHLFSIEVTEATDIQLQSVKETNVYPVPASTHITIETNGLYNYELRNSLGQIISNGRINSTQTVLDLSALAVGTYYLHFRNKKVEFAKKIVVVN